MLNGVALNYDVNSHRLTVYLPQSLAPGAQVTLAMRFHLSIPAKVKDHPYGYDVDQVNLTDWFPFVVPYSNGWVLHDDYYLGEHLVQDAADFEVNVRVTEGSIVFAASGVGEPNNEWTRYRLFGARTFALSGSDQFQFVEAAAGAAVIGFSVMLFSPASATASVAQMMSALSQAMDRTYTIRVLEENT